MPKSADSPERDPKDVPMRKPPAKSRERRMEQLASLAEDLLEERVRKGTASPTETVALLRANSPTEIANLRRINAQTAYLEAQREKAIADTVSQDMMDKAIAAMSRYRGENR